MTTSDSLTALLSQWKDGPDVHERILPLVYADLRRIAGSLSAKERTGHTLQATGLVSEAYIRLAEGGPYDSRAHFFGAAANAMRHALVDYARRRGARRRGGDWVRVEMEDSMAAPSEECQQIEDMHGALTCLETHEPRQAALVGLRYFAGLSVREAAETLGISESTAKEDWKKAKDWLQKRLGE